MFRKSKLDAWCLAPPLVQIALLALALGWASEAWWRAALCALALGATTVWVLNTTAHYHLHYGLFRSGGLNGLLSLVLTIATGTPQTAWRHMHIDHHRGAPTPWARAEQKGLVLEMAVVAGFWALAVALAPRAMITVLLPGFLIGMLLCKLQGDYEHREGRASAPDGISYYAVWYNVLWLNDGYHVEHHRSPGIHWADLPQRRATSAAESRWPPHLRWMSRRRAGGAA